MNTEKKVAMVHFVGAGCGAPDLITVRGMYLLGRADIIIYAGSLVNPELLNYAKEPCRIYNSAKMTLEAVTDVFLEAREEGLDLVRLHTGDPSLYGAIREQMDILDEAGIAYDVTPGVTAAFGAAASLGIEYTLPEVSQTLILTRMEGKTSVPDREKIESLAAHGASMAVYLSAGMLDELADHLMAGGYKPDTPAALVYKASWEDEKSWICSLGKLAETGRRNGISKTALVLVGDAVAHRTYARSKLYDPDFSTEYRRGSHMENGF